MHRPTLTTDPWPYPPTPAPQRDGLALPQIVGVLRRAWAWILVPTLLAGLAAGAFVQIVPPRYTGEAKVLLESRDPAFAKSAAERNEPAQPIDEQAVASQVQVAMSRDIAREAIRQLKLVGNPEFDPSGGEIGPIQAVLASLGLIRNPLDRSPEDRVLEAYYERLLVYPVGKSRILAFEFRSRDPALAAEAANTIAQLYIASLAAAQVDTARYASTWLGANIDGLRARVAEAEGKVEAYRAKNGLIGTGTTANQPLSAQQLGELSSQLTQARTIKADLAARVKLLKEMIKEGRAFEIPDVANNELIRRTVESRMAMRAQLALESRTLLPAHPRIKELTAQVNDLEGQIKTAAERIVRTLENDARIAGARVDSLQAAVDGQRDVVAKGNDSEIQLRALEREAKVQREQLESYLSRYREAAARDGESAAPADARVVSKAVVPDMPSFPKKLPIIGVATALAFLLSAGAVVGRHLLATPPMPASYLEAVDDADEDIRRFSADPERLAYPEPMPPHADMPVRPSDAASAPTTRSEDERTADLEPAAAMPAPSDTDATSRRRKASAERAPAAEPVPSEDRYDLDLLIGRLGAGPSHGGRCVLVVETPRLDGRDADLAATLAAALAERGRTLAIDIDGRSGRHAPDCGLTDLVAGEAAFPDVIRAVPGSRLHAVGRGQVELDVLVEEPQGLAITFNAMAQVYEWVVCALAASDGETGRALLATVSASMDAVVIASEAAADDPGLVALFRLVEESGAGQVLVARAGGGASRDEALPELEMELRLSAA